MADTWVYFVAPVPALIYDYIRDGKAQDGFINSIKQNFGNSAPVARFLDVLPRDRQIDIALKVRDGGNGENLILEAMRDVANTPNATAEGDINSLLAQRRNNQIAVSDMILDRLTQNDAALKHYTSQMTDDQKLDIARDFVSGGKPALENKIKETVWDVALAEKISDPAMRDTINAAVSRENRIRLITEFQTDPAKGKKDIEVAVFDALVTKANPAAALLIGKVSPDRKAELMEIEDPKAREAAITKELTDKKNETVKNLKDGLGGLFSKARADAGPDSTSPKLAGAGSVTTLFALANLNGVLPGTTPDTKNSPAITPRVSTNNATA